VSVTNPQSLNKHCDECRSGPADDCCADPAADRGGVMQQHFPARKLTARYGWLVAPLLLSLCMTCIVSLISTLRGVGLVSGLFGIWLGSWAMSLVIAFPTLLLVQPLVRRATAALVAIDDAPASTLCAGRNALDPDRDGA